MAQPKLLPKPFADGGDKNTIPDTSTGGAANWSQGFPPITALPLAAGGVAPDRMDFNGIFYAITAHTVFQQQGGVYQYSNTIDYTPPALVCGTNSKLYLCIKANGPTSQVQPLTNATYWQPVIVAQFTGATQAKAGTAGIVPAPQAGDQAKFLTGGKKWQPVATKAQAEAGTDDAAPMTALKVKQAIDKQLKVVYDALNAAGEPIAYKTVTSIQSVKGSFWTDNTSSAAASLTSDLPNNGTDDWVLLQLGAKTGNDKMQLFVNGGDVWMRADDNVSGSEKWNQASWKKIIGASGAAAAAAVLETARKINGVPFDGSKDITIKDDTKLPLAGGTMTGDISFSGNNRMLRYKGADGSLNTQPVMFYDDGNVGDNNPSAGTGIRIGAGGQTVIGGGESSFSLIAELKKSGEYSAYERMHVCNDGAVNIHSDCQTIENRKTYTFSGGNLTMPSGGKVIGALQGNADTATNATKLNNQTADYYRCSSGCSWTCSSNCTDGCSSCTSGCAGGCTSGCKGACSTTCIGSCAGSCGVQCQGSCTAACSSRE